jgi:putative Ca2+/H+ antiporter (TMEM165/GDT1 family)
MEAFIVSFSSVAVAEMGDRTQLLALILAARFRKPWPILAGVLLATLANHAAAGLVGVWFGRLLTPRLLDGIVAASLLAMSLWTLQPDELDLSQAGTAPRAGAFLATLIAFFVAEIGDKTQIATVALAAAYRCRSWSSPARRWACCWPTRRWSSWARRSPRACR